MRSYNLIETEPFDLDQLQAAFITIALVWIVHFKGYLNF